MDEKRRRAGLSVIIPCYNEEEVFPQLRLVLEDFLNKFSELNPEILTSQHQNGAPPRWAGSIRRFEEEKKR